MLFLYKVFYFGQRFCFNNYNIGIKMMCRFQIFRKWFHSTKIVFYKEILKIMRLKLFTQKWCIYIWNKIENYACRWSGELWGLAYTFSMNWPVLLMHISHWVHLFSFNSVNLVILHFFLHLYFLNWHWRNNKKEFALNFFKKKKK